MRYRARAALGLVVLALVGSCVSNDSPTSVGERLPANIVLQPALIPSPADSSALPINRIRVVTARVPDNTVLSDTTVVVQPADASWSLDFRIPLPASPTRALSFLYLMNEAAGGVRSVEFSGLTDTLTLVAGQTTSPADIPLARGPIGNLFVTGVTITNATTALVQGLTLSLAANVQSSAPSTQARVYWTSRDTSVVRIDSTTAFGVAPGVAQVIASAGAFADTTLLTVGNPPVDSVEVSPNSANVMVGLTRVYTVRVLDAGGGVLTGRIVRWSTGSTSVATVDSITGVVTAVAPGTTTVRATSEGAFDDATVVVVPVPVRSVLVSPDSADVAIGNTIAYSAQTFDSIGGVLTGRVVTWSSANTGVATVNATLGAVAGLAPGTTTVRATSEGVFDDAVVRVTSVAPATLNRWQSAVSGNWSDSTRWSRGTVPVAGDSAVIDVPGTYTVTVDVNSTVAGVLVGGSSGTQTLAIASRTVTLGGAGMIGAGGVLNLASSTLNGAGTLTNRGTLVAQSSTIAAALVNEGLLRLRAAMTISGGLTTTSTSTLRVEGDGNCCAATTTVSSSFTNNGLIELTTVNVATSAQLTVSGTLTNAAGALIQADAGAGGGTRDIVAIIDNAGTIDVFPGNAGRLGINGGLINSGTLDVDLSGLTAQSQHDQIVVTGATVLGGVVDVALFGGFTPTTGNVFDFITSTGAVSNTLALGTTPTAGWTVTNVPGTPNRVRLTAP